MLAMRFLSLFTGLILTANVCHSQGFDTFLEQLRADVAAAGLSVSILDAGLGDNPQPLEHVQKKRTNQPESKFSFKRYHGSLVSDERIARGKKKMATYADDLNRAAAQSGVPAEVITALWGIETYYGKLTGGFEVIPALTTLVYESHRKEFFRKELFAVLQLVEEGHTTPQATGSWAGAMGQCQFMPTSFINYAADGNGDGKKDIWHTEADVFASAGNYLKQHKWQTGQPIVQRVVLGEVLPKLEYRARALTEGKTIAEWEELGVFAAKGGFALPADTKAHLFIPEGPSGKVYLTYPNFDVIMRWNRSAFFAFAVAKLAENLAS